MGEHWKGTRREDKRARRIKFSRKIKGEETDIAKIGSGNTGSGLKDVFSNNQVQKDTQGGKLGFSGDSRTNARGGDDLRKFVLRGMLHIRTSFL